MFIIETPEERLKTFSIKKVFEFLEETKTLDLKYFYDFEEYDQHEFFKYFLEVSRDYKKYLFLEKKFNKKPNLKDYAKNYNKSQVI